MYLFWDTIIHPLFRAYQPRVIVEIGAGEGLHTRRVLEYCRKQGALLHSIDPRPAFDPEVLRRQYPGCLVFHFGYSLEVLPLIQESVDVILIDGDHNWYTVLNELRLIEKRAKHHSHSFPLVFLHDVGWPYGRRDLYYEPQRVPEEYRQMYEKKGLRPGASELQKTGGLNTHLHNATLENTPHNGVLTAVEDFLTESDHALDFFILPGLNGLGILAPKLLRNSNPELVSLFNSLSSSEAITKHLELLETQRISYQIGDADKAALLKNKDSEIAAMGQRVDRAAGDLVRVRENMQSQLDGRNEELARLNNEIKRLTGETSRYVDMVEKLTDRLVQTEQLLAESHANLAAKDRQQEIQSSEISTVNAALEKSRSEAVARDGEVQRLKGHLTEVERSLAEVGSESEMLRNRLQRGELHIQMIAQYVEQLEKGLRALLRSRRWRFGNRIGELYWKLHRNRKVPWFDEYFEKVLNRIRDWKIEVARESGKPLVVSGKRPETKPDNNRPSLSGAHPKVGSPPVDPEITKILEQRRICTPHPPQNTHILLYGCGQYGQLRRAVLSIKRHTDLSVNFLHIIEDSQNPAVGKILDELCEGIPYLKIIRPIEHQGYFRAIRSAIDDIPSGDICILRDTVVVTPDWLGGLKHAAHSADSIGIVSPITNDHPCYSFRMKPGDNVMTCARKLHLLGARQYPAAFPDPNVFYLRRQALRLVPFPNNADDSLDLPFFHLVLELLKKKIIPVLTDDTFVFVSKRFNRFSQQSVNRSLGLLHDKKLAAAHSLLEYTRRLNIPSINGYRTSEIELINATTIGVLFAGIIVRGGVLILTEMTNDLILDNVDAKAILLNANQYEPELFDLLFEPLVTGNAEEIAKHLPNGSAIMATFWPTADLAGKVVNLKPSIKGYYFMQDFEVWFYDAQNAEQKQYYDGALQSYHLNLEQLTSSDWIAGKVRKLIDRPDHPIQKIGYGIDLCVFHPGKDRERPENARIIAMARPETPRRGFDDLIDCLKLVHSEDPSVEIRLFGSANLKKHSIPFPHTDLGIIGQEDLSQEYRDADIFIDSSLFQGFGLAALEAMACGCTCVVTNSGGAAEYVEHRANAIAVEPGNPKEMARQVLSLTRDKNLRAALRANGKETALKFSNHSVGRSVLDLLNKRASERAKMINSLASDATCNIIVPVYNQLHVVRPCLESILKYTTYPYRAYVVDDASDRLTAAYLRDLCEKNANFFYLRNEKNLGFVGSVNRGMAETESGHLLLLNSDTIVTPGWLEKMMRCVLSDDAIGIVSPLTTTSSHLWIKPNPGDSIFDTASHIERLSERQYPNIVTPEGWCFLIHRRVYEHLGQFDPVFGQGYCEESDYSMRAYANGYRLVCCDDTFIYHEGRAAFGNERGPRYTRNREIFDSRWKPLYTRVYAEFLTRDPLNQLRVRYQRSRSACLTWDEARKLKHPEVISILEDPALGRELKGYKRLLAEHSPSPIVSPKVVFLVSTLEQNGGVLSVVQLVNDMIQAGIDTKAVVIHPKRYAEDLPLLTEPIFYSSRSELLRHFPKADIVVGTLWATMYYVAQLFVRRRNFVPAYFVQDFEPRFYRETETGIIKMVTDTYQLTPFCFAKTEWICEQVRNCGGRITLVPPALDLDVFYPRDNAPKRDRKVLLTMLRPSTPQRGTETAVRVLRQLSRERDDLEIHTFGADDVELEKLGLDFPIVNHGKVRNAALPQLYSTAYVYMDCSLFHGFGRTIAEAMACGTPAVVTDSGGVSSFAVNDVNCLIAAPGDTNALLRNLRSILDDSALHSRLAARTYESVKGLDRRYSSAETVGFLTAILGQFPKVSPSGDGDAS